MIQMSVKQERRKEREWEKSRQIARDLESSLLSFRSKIHKMLQEPVGGALAAFHPPDYSRTPGKRIKPYIQGEVIEPLEPVKLKKGTKLVLKGEGREFKEPIVSPAMQRNLRTLELRLDSKGFLYSPKTFDPDWNWQTQAIWLRLIGLGYIEIGKRIKKSLNTVKSMFKRLNISKFFPRVSRKDWSTIGFGAKETPSGWNIILYGGSSGMLYPSSEMIVNERSGEVRPRYVAHFSVGEKIGKEYTLKRKPFSIKEHKKEMKKGLKEEKERKELMTFEQKTIQIENLQRNIERGFDPETGRYHDKKGV